MAVPNKPKLKSRMSPRVAANRDKHIKKILKGNKARRPSDRHGSSRAEISRLKEG